MPSRRSRPPLGELERAVMEALWDSGRLSVREVHDRLRDSRDVAYTTVMTVLDRLHGKGLVRRRKQDRAYSDAATGSREQLTADLMRDALGELGGDGREAALVAFVGDASATDRDALRAALDALEEEAAEPGDGRSGS